MNITYYKQKLQRIKYYLSHTKKDDTAYDRLMIAKKDCLMQIRKIKIERENKKNEIVQ